MTKYIIFQFVFLVVDFLSNQVSQYLQNENLYLYRKEHPYYRRIKNKVENVSIDTKSLVDVSSMEPQLQIRQSRRTLKPSIYLRESADDQSINIALSLSSGSRSGKVPNAINTIGGSMASSTKELDLDDLSNSLSSSLIAASIPVSSTYLMGKELDTITPISASNDIVTGITITSCNQFNALKTLYFK